MREKDERIIKHMGEILEKRSGTFSTCGPLFQCKKEMTMTRKKNIKQRKNNNKIRRYCRWKRITIQQYFSHQYFDTDEFAKALSKYFEDVINGLRAIVENINSIDCALSKQLQEKRK